jgi:hypothetical protein
MNAAVGAVANVPSRHRPGLVGDGALYHEDQLVADVPMRRELRAGREANHLGPPFRYRILP